MSLRVLVVDDEPVARRRLLRMLAAMKGVEVAGEAADGAEALERIRDLAPDAVLLDIRMPGIDGLTLARSVRNMPPVIFTTAYDEHALEAFDAEAVDYLMKPVRAERLERALDRIRERRGNDPERLERVLQAVLQREGRTELVRLTARSGDVTRVFDPRKIGRIHAADKYAVFHHEGNEYVLDETLSTLEERLGGIGFLRVHRSELVNLEKVVALHHVDGGTEAELAGGLRVPVSRRLAPELKRRLGIRG